MASITFSADLKGIFQICNDKEVLHGIGLPLSSMWTGCGNCDGCNHMPKKFDFVIEELTRVGFDKRTENSLWSIYKETNQYCFEIQKYNDL